MKIEIKIPSPGESITEVELASWAVADGDFVEKDQEIAEIESDKATLPLIAAESGIININIAEGTTAKVGDVACVIDSSATQQAPTKIEEEVVINNVVDDKNKQPQITEKPSTDSNIKATPLAKKIIEKNNLNVEQVVEGLRKLTKTDVDNYLQNRNNIKVTTEQEPTDDQRIKMSSLRKKISERLVSVKNETAMLTTFNEIDMTAVKELRTKFGKRFADTHDTRLGFMSFFTKAASLALNEFPMVKSYIDDGEIVIPSQNHIGIAVQAKKGLMVPVVRNTEQLSVAETEKNIALIADRARSGKITIDELNGGIFTITNGGVFGSMMSTPILNPPQSGILGLHAIIDRPVAINGKVEIRPMMYIALSYDHRLIDGKDSVGFLVKVKQLIENPLLMLMPAGNAHENLLGL